jgi:ferric-dicitrate binding protein FerR (iron transport regulator)
VTLNANSSLSFKEEWNLKSAREVWLKGEAFFEVEKMFSHVPSQTPGTVPVKFIVHTSPLEVEVLGTQFNVNNRREETKVVLKSGKVKLNVKAGEKIEEIFMKPGEMVAYNEVSKALTKSVVDPDIHASWKDHHLIFEEASLGEISHMLEDVYGVIVAFEDPQLAHEQFTGLVPSDDLNVLLEAFTKLYGLQVTKKQNTIIFHSQ